MSSVPEFWPRTPLPSPPYGPPSLSSLNLWLLSFLKLCIPALGGFRSYSIQWASTKNTAWASWWMNWNYLNVKSLQEVELILRASNDKCKLIWSIGLLAVKARNRPVSVLQIACNFWAKRRTLFFNLGRFKALPWATIFRKFLLRLGIARFVTKQI